jgi:septum formation protein
MRAGCDRERVPLPQLVLASASPRRLSLLRQVGYRPLVDPAHVDETPDPSLAPAEDAARLARHKALVVAERRPRDLVLGADTIVTIGRELLGKPRDEADARRMLERLSGRMHQVVTSVFLTCLDDWPQTSLTVTTQVIFRALDEGELAGYLASREWEGKAGAYAVQGRAAAFTLAVVGSYSNVVGLPLCEVVEELSLRGLRPDFHTAEEA